LGLRKTSDIDALRIGTAIHYGRMQMINRIVNWREMIANGYTQFGERANDAEQLQKLEYEFHTVITLLEEYNNHWQNQELNFISFEIPFKMEIVNPETGCGTPIFQACGKGDAIIDMGNDRLALNELKTTSDDIALDSDYWRKIRLDAQITLYLLAFDKCKTVLYDVIHKPTIRPTNVPLLDENGEKQVIYADGTRAYTKDGKRLKQSVTDSSIEHLLSRPMTGEEWANKLREHIQKDPFQYYSRMEIARTSRDFEEFKKELWQIQKQIRLSQNKGYWFKNTQACFQPFRCEYFEFCSNNIKEFTETPLGFEFKDNKHPELNEE
jgi:hypothetical protein